MKISRRRTTHTAFYRRSGLTLVEMMLAMSITAMVGLALTTMLSSVAYSTTSQAQLRRSNVRGKVLSTRIDTAIRSSKMVLAQGNDFLVLWMGDSRRNGVPNLSELRRIQRDDATGTLTSYKAPSGLSEVNDTPYSPADDFGTITAGLMGTANFPSELWATGVTAWTQSLNQTNPQVVSLLSYALTLEIDSTSSTFTNTVSLRGR